MGGATGYLGDAMILEGDDWLGLAVGYGAAIALLAVFVVSPGIDLREGGREGGGKSVTRGRSKRRRKMKGRGRGRRGRGRRRRRRKMKGRGRRRRRRKKKRRRRRRGMKKRIKERCNIKEKHMTSGSVLSHLSTLGERKAMQGPHCHLHHFSVAQTFHLLRDLDAGAVVSS